MTLTSVIPPTGRNFGVYTGRASGAYPDLVALLLLPGQDGFSSHEMVGLSTVLTRLPGHAFAAAGPDVIVLYGQPEPQVILGQQGPETLFRSASELIREFYAGAHLARSPLAPDAVPYLGHPVSFTHVPAPWTGLLPVPVKLTRYGELTFSLPPRQSALALPGLEDALANNRPALRLAATPRVLAARPLSPELHLPLAATHMWAILKALRAFELTRRRNRYSAGPRLPIPLISRELFR